MNVKDVPKDPAKRWEWIKYQLRISGCCCAELARQLGVTDRAIRLVKQIPYPRIEKAIASALDTRPVLLWPERWNPDGSPSRRRPRRADTRQKQPVQDSDNGAAVHRKNGGAR